MRIEQIVSREYSQRGSGQQRDNRTRPRLRLPRICAEIVRSGDTLEIEGKRADPDRGCQWLVAYVRLMPEDLALERVKQAFSEDQSEEDAFTDKLMFAVL